MSDLVNCPACEGRGSYCVRVLDPVWSTLAISDTPCELCEGSGKVTLEEVHEYDLSDGLPAFRYSPYYPYDEA